MLALDETSSYEAEWLQNYFQTADKNPGKIMLERSVLFHLITVLYLDIFFDTPAFSIIAGLQVIK